MKENDIEKIRNLVIFGGEIAGPAIGEAVGYLTGGVQGAMFGGMFGSTVTRVIGEMASRVLSTREKTRVGATAAYTLVNMKQRLEAGEKIRDDGFFNTKDGNRSNAEEIFEGVLLKAKNEHEEKKSKILANIFSNIAFKQGFSIGEANHLLHIAENLTYREMCILSLAKRKGEIEGITLRKIELVKETSDGSIIINFSIRESSVLQQCYELCDKGLLICSDLEGNTLGLSNAFDVDPSELNLTIMGDTFYQIMGLDDLPEEDIRDVAQYLS